MDGSDHWHSAYFCFAWKNCSPFAKNKPSSICDPRENQLRWNLPNFWLPKNRACMLATQIGKKYGFLYLKAAGNSGCCGLTEKVNGQQKSSLIIFLSTKTFYYVPPTPNHHKKWCFISFDESPFEESVYSLEMSTVGVKLWCLITAPRKIDSIFMCVAPKKQLGTKMEQRSYNSHKKWQWKIDENQHLQKLN